MKVVISGYYGFHNVGDEAILLSIISALRKAKSDIEIVVLSNDPDFTKKEYGVDAVNRWSLKEVRDAFSEADGFISGGGSLLQDKTGFRSVPYYSGLMLMANMMKKPFFVYAQGIGPVDRGYNQRMIKWILSKATWLSVRDEDSKALLERIGVRKEIELVPDPVIGLEVDAGKFNWLDKQGLRDAGSVVTVSVRDWGATIKPFKEKIAAALDRAVSAGVNVVFVPMHGEHDDHTSRELVGMMKEDAYVFPYDASIEEKVAVIGESDLLVGMRLHALIFSAIGYTPMIGISYDPKIDSFLRQVAQPKIGHVDEDWTADQLYDLIQKQLGNLSEEQDRLRAAIDPLKKEAGDTAAVVVEYLEGKST